MSAVSAQDERRTRARLKQLLERSAFDLKLTQDAARSLEEFAVLQRLAKARREIEGAKADILEGEKRKGNRA